MALITLQDAQLAFGHHPLLAHADFALEAGERVALVGRNGAGKSSLLKVIAGLEPLDDGTLQLEGGVRRWYVAQESSFAIGRSVFDAVADGLAEARELRARFEALGRADSAECVLHQQMDALQSRIETLDGWNWEQRVQLVLDRLGLDGAQPVGELSGGGAKRVALAQALAAAPDVLLLDEPTNHLDIDAIEWLQATVLEAGAAGRGGVRALMFVSHDRAFIDAVATRIVELDRGVLRSYPGAFAQYEQARERELHAQALQSARDDKLLAQEEVWIRQGVEARRTRSVARVARLQGLRQQRAERRERLGQVRMEIAGGLPSGKLVAELDDVSIARGGRTIIDGFSATVLRGDKVGLIGPNGAGKTTMLRLILGELEPDAGRVRRGTRLAVAYFDQMRQALDLDATLADTISPGSDWVEIGGQRKHVIGYLSDFLFAPQRANAPVRTLSGGERNRLLLARLFALPANLLVLDEPTNDLDIDTLELLEERLQAYDGTVLLVSHDRWFLDRVVTSTIAWEGDARQPGRWRETEGGYADWLQQRRRALELQAVQADAQGAPRAFRSAGATGVAAEAGSPSAAAPAVPATRRKLSYREQRELDALPQRIEDLEAEQQRLGDALADSALYVGPDAARAGAMKERYDAIEVELMECLERWEALGAVGG